MPRMHEGSQMTDRFVLAFIGFVLVFIGVSFASSPAVACIVVGGSMCFTHSRRSLA